MLEKSKTVWVGQAVQYIQERSGNKAEKAEGERKELILSECLLCAGNAGTLNMLFNLYNDILAWVVVPAFFLPIKKPRLRRLGYPLKVTHIFQVTELKCETRLSDSKASAESTEALIWQAKEFEFNSEGSGESLMVFEQENNMIGAIFRKIAFAEIKRELQNGERLETS